MKLGGLFSGIGGFELAWQRQGGTVAWMCEIDPAARKVLEHRFPGVPIYRDVSELDPAEVEAVDVVTGGSPCQGFSIAGARTGLEHVESRLFADYVRIVDGLAGRGLSYAVWENVPGVLSITNDDGERTFPHVVAALVGADRPVHLNGGARWNTGLAVRGGRAVAWRVVDSRHFGVPQRRRRVFACVAFGDSGPDRAGRALLAKPEGVSGDSAACSQAGQELAGTLRASLGGGSAGDSWDTVGHVAACLTSREGKGPDSDVTTTLIPQVSHTLRGEGFDASEDGTGRGTPLVPQSFNWQSGGDARVLDPTPDVSALTTQQTPAVLSTMREGKDGGGKDPLISEDESLTLATGNSQVLFEPYCLQGSLEGRGDQSGPQGSGWKQGESYTLNTTDRHAVTQTYGVRRLTPVECERLQAFPDGWTEPAGSDSARYRALGNAITVNVAAWLFGRMAW